MAQSEECSGVVATMPVAMAAASDMVRRRGCGQRGRSARWRPTLKHARQGKLLGGPG
jgi:hypothetical protein